MLGWLQLHGYQTLKWKIKYNMCEKFGQFKKIDLPPKQQ